MKRPRASSGGEVEPSPARRKSRADSGDAFEPSSGGKSKAGRPRSSSLPSVQDSESPFHVLQCEATFSLPPAYVGRAHQGVYELLNAKLVEFDDRLGGVLLSYSNVLLRNAGSGIVGVDAPEAQFRARFEALLFKPRSGMKLRGMITHVTAGHLMLLFCSVFPVTVQRSNIHPRYKFSESFDKYVDEDDEDDVLKPETMVTFEVLELNAQSPFSMEASLMAKARR